jgi:hypothetical protein
VSVASKLQIKQGQSVCVIGRPQDVTRESDVVIVYCVGRADLEELSEPLLAAASRDALTWVVRQIAIDEVWSALRLRPA